MKYNELTLSKQKSPKRAGRGISAGRGKTAGRGTKGQGARKSTPRPGFEGGQNPLYARVPKLRGFKSHRRIAETVYTGQIDAIKSAKIDNQSVFDAALVSSPYCSVKLLVKGGLSTKKEVRLQSASKNAVEAIEEAGGTFHKTAQIGRPAKKAAKSSE